MTGKHPARLHLTNWIGGEQKGKLLQAPYVRQLPREEVTIGEAFQEAGYYTGYIGKWHLGKEGFMPKDQGFVFSKAVNFAGQPGHFFAPYENPNWPITNVPDLEADPPKAYLTDRLTDIAVDFLETHQNEPFFLVLSHYAVHTPLQAKANDIDHYERKAATLPSLTDSAFVDERTFGLTKQRQDHPTYAAMIASTDASVGRIMHVLDSLDLTSNTIVVFVSDNGGLSTLQPPRRGMPTSNSPLRAGKGWMYEGGIRAPFIVSWPLHIKPSVEAIPVMSTDLYPTLLSLAALPSRPDQHRDGESLKPLLMHKSNLQRTALHWHFPHYHGSGNRPTGAIRSGDYKLVEWFEEGTPELFDLASDPQEATNIARSHPELADSLQTLLATWRQSTGARMPIPNPDWEE